MSDRIQVKGVIQKGYGVASGKAGDRRFLEGTISMQKPIFAQKGLNLDKYFAGTLNVSIHPYQYSVKKAKYTFKNVKWSSEQPSEDFSFFDCRVILKDGRNLEGLIYYPHPETKPEHFQKPEVLEILTQFIAGLQYGEEVILEIDREQIEIMSNGFDRLIYLAIGIKPLDYRTEQPGWASFAKTIPDNPQNYRILAFEENWLKLDINIAEEQFNIHDIQPLPTKEILLVCARSLYKSPNDFQKNGRIYSLDGQFKREILLGDGIQSVQATSDGKIWTSFFDEGVFGNFGWNEPVGSSGLVAWDLDGNKIYDFQPAYGLDSICDCYALNVESNSDVWLYYYTEFPLVRLHNKKIQSVWNMPISGSDNCFPMMVFRTSTTSGKEAFEPIW